jgi:hypothetical protein
MWDTRTGHELVSGAFRIGGFDRSGRNVAVSTGDWLVIARNITPSIVRVFRGHRQPVQNLAWSMDGRYLVSLDAGFVARVWDVTERRELAMFRAPVGGFFPGNTGLAISDDGRLVAYASGGRDSSVVEIRDVRTSKSYGPWELSGGFELLAPLGKDQFRLVREEFVPGSEVVQSVLYHLQPSKSPERVRVIREPQPADTRRFFDKILTPDGRYYAWCGPRHPKDSHRLEVIDIDNGQRALSEQLNNPIDNGDPRMDYDPVSRMLSLKGRYPRTVRVPGAHPNSDEEVYWRITGPYQPPDGRLTGVGLTGSSFIPEQTVEFWAASPDGSWLAWPDPKTGAILVADRPALRKAINEFDLRTFR